MELIATEELRKALPTCVKRVQEDGETFVITRHGKPVALLAPLQGGWSVTDAGAEQ